VKFSFFKNRLFLTVLAGLLIGLFAVSRITGWIVDWLWMGHLGYGDIFLTLLSVKLGLFGVAFFVVFLYPVCIQVRAEDRGRREFGRASACGRRL